MDWDVFISHAWEDKESFARPLAKALEAEGLRVWFDEFTLRVGDRLRRSIDHGLANSRYGIVILSPHFFAKEWPQKELDGLAVREVSGGKVILPVWHNITADQVRRYSPTLADRVAVSSSHGLEYVVAELLRVVQQEAAQRKAEQQEQAKLAAERAEAERKAARLSELLRELDQARSNKDWRRLAEAGQMILLMEDIPEAARDAARSAVADGYYWWDDAAFKYYDYDSILSEITRAIEVSPEQADYYWMRGVNYHTAAFHGHPSGDYDWAIADYTRAIALDPQKADYYRSRGASYHNKGDYDRAIADKTRAIELDPNKANYYDSRSASYDQKGDYDRAIADETRAIQLDPNKADYYDSRGASYHEKGDYDRAIADSNRAIELDPNKANYYHSRSTSYHEEGDYERAIADETRAIELDPGNGQYYYSRGLSYELRGNQEAARRDFQRAAELGHVEPNQNW